MAEPALAPGRLEKLGLRVFQRFGPLECELGDQSRIITSEEKHALLRTQRRAVFFSGLAGAISAGISGMADLWAGAQFGNSLNYWLVFGGITLIVSSIEILYLYQLALASVHRIASVCDVGHLPQGRQHDSQLVLSLVRAALEMNSSREADPYVDPHKYAARWKIFFISVAYKLKVIASNMLAKIFIRKVLLRGATRTWLSFIAVPITAFWNAIVCYWITKEAIVRSIGPSYIEETIPNLLEDKTLHECAQRAVACSIAASNNLHPNHAYLLQFIRQHTGTTISHEPESLDIFEQQFRTLTQSRQALILDILGIAIMIDGKIKPSEMELYNQLSDAGVSSALSPQEHFEEAFQAK